MTPIDLVVEEHFHRAAPGGMGGTKAAGNYSPVSGLQLINPKILKQFVSDRQFHFLLRIAPSVLPEYPRIEVVDLKLLPRHPCAGAMYSNMITI